MPAKIWYNGSMHNMTALKMVTFVNGEKKYLTKGVTFVNGEKKILWQTGNFSIDSWTLSQLHYPNQNGLPVGLYCNENRMNYSVGEYVARANVANISAPTNENCVKNGRIRTWLYPYYTNSNESYVGDVKSYTTMTISTAIGGKITVQVELTTVNKLNLDTNDLSVVSTNSASDNKNSQFFYNGIYCYDSSYGWVSVRTNPNGKYIVYKNSTTQVVQIPVTGYTTSNNSPALPFVAIQSGGYIVLTSKYQATSGGAITYGLKRVNLANGTVTDIEAGLTTEVTSVLVDGSNLVYSYGNTVVKADADGSNKVTYTGTNTPAVLIGRIGDYYYAGSCRTVAGDNAKYLTIDIIDADTMALRESRPTNTKATIINALPYISNNEYLCFGTYHAVSYNSTTSPTLQTTYRTLPTGTLSDVEYKLSRIHGF